MNMHNLAWFLLCLAAFGGLVSLFRRGECVGQLQTILHSLRKLLMNQQELADKLTAVGDKLDKAKKEIVDAVQALKDALDKAGATSPAVDAAVARIEGAATGLDDLNQDAPAA